MAPALPFPPLLMLFWDDCNDLILMVAHTSAFILELYFNVLLCDTILCLHSNNISPIHAHKAIIIARMHSYSLTSRRRRGCSE